MIYYRFSMCKIDIYLIFIYFTYLFKKNEFKKCLLKLKKYLLLLFFRFFINKAMYGNHTQNHVIFCIKLFIIFFLAKVPHMCGKGAPLWGTFAILY